ncbi:Stearoyl-CoA desaturase [Mycena venus]|uniref:Stearoyl-CoA desaturase n=1 Tax=Mycena venus TaxID=2733690 RepID=A0A8H7CU63_9AGAR|nr:Stearoyl-CoA desaturase [Mycena venus]
MGTDEPPKIAIWWSNAIFFIATHAFAVWGALCWRPIYAVPTQSLVLALLVWQLADFGITIGYHRLYSHRAFRAKFAVRVVLAALGSAGFQGSIKRFTDDPVHDPYAATKGLFYSHMGWIFFKPTYERMELVDREDLDSDPVVRFQHKHYVPIALFFGFVLPTLLGTTWGDPSGAFVWGGLVSRLAIWHCTFLVNSLAHWDGLQPYSDEDTSRGNLLLALLTGGEGSHNFHVGLVSGLRSVRDEDLKEAMQYMHHKDTHGVPPPQEDAPWDGETWDIQQAHEYIQSKPGRCLVVIEDYFVDVTSYLGEHPGGATLLRKYSVRPEKDLIEASWAFNGGLNYIGHLDMKRAHSQRNGGDAEAMRVKRRKEMAVAGSSSDVDITSPDPVADDERVKARVVDVREQGLKLWQTIKDAVNKEGRPLSVDFVRKPSKKLYPDYYVYIQHPIALEDIKKQLESNVYPTLEAVRQDFELCFENAKTYNMKDSVIWRDAKDLLKLTNKTYHKMVPTEEEGEPTGKKPSLHRLAKTRLQKIIAETDENGRVRSALFMELVSKKDWPSYYQIIKQPRCLGAIMAKIKKKEYFSMVDFADDVELVFSNAMEFNQDHTQIWEDALALQTMFRELICPLPQLRQVPRLRLPPMPPVVLRVPGATTAKASTPVVAPAPLPTPTPPPKAATASPALLPNPLPNSSYTLPNSNSIPSSNTIQAAPQPPPPPATFINTTTPAFAHYPHAAYPARTTTPLAPVATPAPAPPPPPPVVNPTPAKNLSVSNSPAPPPIHPSHMLKGVSLMTEPCKRPFMLDHRDGVKTWAMRLGPGERALSVSDVTYMGDEEEDSSESSEEEDSEDSEEEESDDAIAKNGKKKGKGRGRGRPKGKAATAAAKALQAARAAKKEARKIGEVQVKLNGNVVAHQADHPGQWMVDLQAGLNLLEVGEKGGLIWKSLLYLILQTNPFPTILSTNMMLVRCQWYDDEGRPVLNGEGCRNQRVGCNFVHPTDREWNIAVRKRTATADPPSKRGRGRGRGGFTSSSSRDSGWGDRRTSFSTSNSDWDADGWKPKSSNTASSVASSSGDPEASTSKPSGQWGSSDGPSKTGDTNTWGSSSWGDTSNNSTWGDTTKSTENTGSWNSGSSGWGASEGWGGGWGTTTTTTTTEASTWGDSSKNEGWGGGWTDSSKNAPSATKSTSVIDTPIVLTSTQPIPSSRPTDLRVNVDDKTPIDAATPQSASSYRAASMAPSERTVAATPSSAFPAFHVPRSAQDMTRSHIHSQIIKNSVRVTRIQLELKELQRELDRWKATQLSSQFHRVSAPAGARLDGIRHGLTLQIKTVKERLELAEKELASCPELPSAAPNLADVDREMMAYTEELTAWLKSFMALAVPETKPPAPSDSSMDVDEPHSKPARPESLFAELEERITNLQDTLEEIQSTIESVSEQTAAYIEDGILDARSKMRAEEGQDQTAGKTDLTGSVASLQSAADQTEKKADRDAERVVLIGVRNEEERKKNEALRFQRDQNRLLLNSMQAQLLIFEKRKQERAQQLAILGQQVALLSTTPRRAPPVLDEGVLTRVRETVEAMIQGEVVPALQAMGMQYNDAMERRMASLQRSIQPAVDQTNEICRRAKATQIEN